jgi:ABC-type antimicrobial peptide transport system ATPase subunit
MLASHFRVKSPCNVAKPRRINIETFESEVLLAEPRHDAISAYAAAVIGPKHFTRFAGRKRTQIAFATRTEQARGAGPIYPQLPEGRQIGKNCRKVQRDGLALDISKVARQREHASRDPCIVYVSLRRADMKRTRRKARI